MYTKMFQESLDYIEIVYAYELESGIKFITAILATRLPGQLLRSLQLKCFTIN